MFGFSGLSGPESALVASIKEFICNSYNYIFHQFPKHLRMCCILCVAITFLAIPQYFFKISDVSIKLQTIPGPAERRNLRLIVTATSQMWPHGLHAAVLFTFRPWWLCPPLSNACSQRPLSSSKAV